MVDTTQEQLNTRRFKKGQIPWNKGKKTGALTKETKEKISLALKGKIPKYHFEKGHIVSDETKKKISDSRIKRKEKLGYINSPETRKKISETNTGRPNTEEQKRKISIALKGRKKPEGFGVGKILSEEHKKNLSIMAEKRGNNGNNDTEFQAGKNHPNWQGGKSFEPYGFEFNKKLKKQIRKRDSFTCQECGFTEEKLGYNLPIHHIDYNKQNNNKNNLISLCKSCHSQTNFKRKDWTNYFKQRLELCL